MHWLPRGGAGKIFIKRKSLKAWVAKKGGGENFDKKNVLFEALLLPRGGAGKILIKILYYLKLCY